MIDSGSSCHICFRELLPEKEAKLENCVHKFCFECIHEWAATTKNVCPVCKKKFNRLTRKDPESKEGELTVEIEDKNIYE